MRHAVALLALLLFVLAVSALFLLSPKQSARSGERPATYLELADAATIPLSQIPSIVNTRTIS